jgi:hypothetical protein
MYYYISKVIGTFYLTLNLALRLVSSTTFAINLTIYKTV